MKKIENATKITGAHGCLQWKKGSDVCIDIQCECGLFSYIDGEFTYLFRCSCGKLWGISPYIRLLPLEEKDIEECADDPWLRVAVDMT